MTTKLTSEVGLSRVAALAAARHRAAAAATHIVQLAKRVLSAIDRAIFDPDGDCMRL